MHELPGWFSEPDARCVTVQGSEGRVWAIAQGADGWLFQRRGDEVARFDTLRGLVENLSADEVSMLTLDSRAVAIVDALAEVGEHLAESNIEAAKATLADFTDGRTVACLPESTSDVAARVRRDALRAAELVSNGYIHGLDETVAALFNRLQANEDPKGGSLASFYLGEPGEVADAIAELESLKAIATSEELDELTEWRRLDLPVAVAHPVGVEVQAIAIPPAHLQRPALAEGVQKLSARAFRAKRLVELDSPEIFLTAELDAVRKRLENAVGIIAGVDLSLPVLEERNDIPVSQPSSDPGSAHGIVLLERIWTPETQEQRGSRILVQTPGELRLFDLDGELTDRWSGCPWRVRGGSSRFAFFAGEKPRLTNGTLERLGVFDTLTGTWVDRWPGLLTDLGDGPLRILGTSTCTLVEDAEHGSAYAVDAARNFSRVFDDDMSVRGWAPDLDIVWVARGSENLLLRVLGGAAEVRLPTQFDQFLDVDAGQVVETPPSSERPKLPPLLRAGEWGKFVFVTADGAVSLDDRPVLQIAGSDVLAVDVVWPKLAVLTSDRILVVRIDAKDEDGFGDDCEVERIIPLS